MNGYDEGERAARVRSELVRLVGSYGAPVLDDVRRVRAMLADGVPGATAEANLIGLALGIGVQSRLQEASADPSRTGSAVEEIARDLERTSSVQPSDARWAVEAIAEAMGLRASAPPRSPSPPVGGAFGGVTAVPAGAPGANGATGATGATGTGGAGDLTVSWSGGRTSARPGQAVLIGRDPSAAVVLQSSAVSRRHGELTWDGSGWTYADLGSTQGSFVDGRRVSTVPVQGSLRLVLGQGEEQVPLDLSAAGAAPAAAAPPPPPPLEAAAAPTGGLRPAVTEARPGGALAAAAAAPTEVGRGSGDVVTVTLGGQTRTAAAGGSVSVGRETDNDLVAVATTVSRHHVRVEQRRGVWTLVDLGSTSGTWLEGRRVGEVALAGRQTFTIGDPGSGDTLVTESAQKARGGGGKGAATPAGGSAGGGRSRGVLVAAAAVATVLVVGGAVFAMTRGGGDEVAEQERPQAVTKDDLARATVYLEAGRFRGSGVVVDAERGLVLTNAHVAAPAALGMAIATRTFAPGLPEDPEVVSISVSRGLDEAAEPTYLGKVIAADGYLDAAVVQITKRQSGTLIESEDLEGLEQVELGDSDAVKTSDKVSFVGYPAVSGSQAPTFTEGVVSGPIQDERLGTPRAEMNTTAKIFGGNSGGLAANPQGQMIGITTWSRSEVTGGESLSSYRPIDLVKPLLAAGRRIADGKGSYTSPYVARAGSGTRRAEDAPSYAVAKNPGRVTAGCKTISQPSSIEALALRYKGLPRKRGHSDVYAEVRQGGRVVATSVTTFPTKLPAKGCMTLSLDRAVPQGSYRVTIGVGGNLKPLIDDVPYSF